MNEPSKLLLTAGEVAQLLRVSPRTVWRWSASGQLPAPLRLGPQTVRWRREDLVCWLWELPGRPAATTPKETA